MNTPDPTSPATPQRRTEPFMPQAGPTICVNGKCYGEHSLAELLNTHAALSARVFKLEQALRDLRDPLDGYVHGDNEIRPQTLNLMLCIVDDALAPAARGSERGGVGT